MRSPTSGPCRPIPRPISAPRSLTGTTTVVRIMSASPRAFKTPRELWQDYCKVTPGIRARFGLADALGYVVGEKLVTFAHTAETDDAFRSELPAFCARIRALFSKEEIQHHFESAERASLVEGDLFKDASPEETEELKEVLQEAQRDRERRSWVKAMLLQSGS